MALVGLSRAIKIFVYLANRRKDLGDLMPDLTKIQFQISDDGEFFLELRSGKLNVTNGTTETPTVTIRADRESFVRIIKGELKQEEAFFMRKVEVTGPVTYLVKLNRLAQKVVSGGGFMSKLLLRFVG